MIISGCRSHVAAQQSFCRKHDTIPSRSNCWQQLAPVHFPKTHPQPQERKNSFSVLQHQLIRGFLFSLAVNLKAPLSFSTGCHFMIIYPNRHLPGYCIYSVLVLLRYQIGMFFKHYHTVCHCTFQKNTTLATNISLHYISKINSLFSFI